MVAGQNGVVMQGRLIYLMGPSGSGKDSLIDAARPALAARGCQVARRVITRSAEAVGEAAQSVSVEQFAQLEAQGSFALSWHANGLAYGVPIIIEQWLAEGRDVLVNGSRGHLPQARARYPALLAIALDVEESVLRRRLLARGRESVEQIEARLERSRQLQTVSPGVVILDNSGALHATVERLLAIIQAPSACA